MREEATRRALSGMYATPLGEEPTSMKRIVAMTLVAGAASIGFIAAPFTASAADCPAGTAVGVHLHGNVNGTPIDQDVCLPPTS